MPVVSSWQPSPAVFALPCHKFCAPDVCCIQQTTLVTAFSTFAWHASQSGGLLWSLDCWCIMFVSKPKVTTQHDRVCMRRSPGACHRCWTCWTAATATCSTTPPSRCTGWRTTRTTSATWSARAPCSACRPATSSPRWSLPANRQITLAFLVVCRGVAIYSVPAAGCMPVGLQHFLRCVRGGLLTRVAWSCAAVARLRAEDAQAARGQDRVEGALFRGPAVLGSSSACSSADICQSMAPRAQKMTVGATLRDAHGLHAMLATSCVSDKSQLRLQKFSASGACGRQPC